jgi:hypothetical protein
MDRALIIATILHPARNCALLFADYTCLPAETVLTRDANSRRVIAVATRAGTF